MFNQVRQYQKQLSKQLAANHQAQFIFTAYTIFIVITIVAATYNLFIKQQYILGSIEASLLLIELYAFHALIYKNNITLATNVFLGVLMLFLLGYLSYKNHQDYAFAIALVFPVVSFFLKGKKTGLLLTIVFLIPVITFILYGVNRWPQDNFNYASAFNLIISLILITFFAYFYERSRDRSESALKIINEKLEHMSTIDALTGLYNRRYLDDHLISLHALSIRNNEPYSLIVFDVDNFKQINDNFGHNEGDSVLKTIGSILKESCRVSDISGRWGGEEFLVVCPKTNASGAKNLADKLLELLSSYEFEFGKTVTASFGVAELNNEKSHKELFHTADEAQYQAKQNGKNQVVVSV